MQVSNIPKKNNRNFDKEKKEKRESIQHCHIGEKKRHIYKVRNYLEQNLNAGMHLTTKVKF